MSDTFLWIALLCITCGLFAIAEAIRAAGRWIAEAIWHSDTQTPPSYRR